ncbi:hypothetical protein AYO44_17320 [Planctomycetaceae bacterium SCGC AG-212-F19]|nr:hypothetical protein AYO44_17320 [Planctomycetaceae bacterium SCGC AG-212-F19]
MLTFVSLLTIVFFVVLIGLVGNIGRTVNEKIEVQNTADSVAYSSALWMARGMNSVTAANHLIGELMSFVVLYDAIGVRSSNPDDQPEVLQGDIDAMKAAKAGAAGASFGTPAYDAIDGDNLKVQVADTVRDGKQNLIKAFTTIYTIKSVASLLEQCSIPPLVAIGLAVDIVATGVEVYGLAEWEFLDTLEKIARPMYDLVRKPLMEIVLPFSQAYVNFIPLLVTEVTEKAAKEIARQNHCTGTLFPLQPTLPLGPDPYWNESGTAFGKSQIVRATYPWVVYRRRPILSVLSWMKISEAADLYLKYTTDKSIDTCREYYDKNNLFMLTIMNPADPFEMKTAGKGNESWTHDTVKADEMFSVIGFAHRPSPQPFSTRVYRQPNPDGIVAYAQAIIWNANLQDPANTPTQPPQQPQVGWDTLNWSRPVGDSHSYEHPEDPGKWSARHDWAPMIRVNWQARLVPVGADRLDDAASKVPAPFSAVMQKTSRLAPQFRTH